MYHAGERAYRRNLPNSRGANITLVIAVSPVLGLVWSTVRWGSMNQHEFLQFLLTAFQVLSGQQDPAIGYVCMCHVSCIMCHVSCVVCRVSYVMCHVSCIMCHVIGRNATRS